MDRCADGCATRHSCAGKARFPPLPEKAAPQRDLNPLTDSLQTAGQPYILFDPFDRPWRSAIGWFRVSQRQMEAFIGKPLEFFATDSLLPLGLVDYPGQRVTTQPDFEFPETWRKAY